MTKVLFEKIHPEAKIPVRTHATDAGMDLYSVENVVIPPNGGRHCVSTGLKIGITPDKIQSTLVVRYSYPLDLTTGYEENFVWQAEVRPRSGLALKHGVTVKNSPGTIDSGYRSEIKIILENNGDQPFEVKVGDRIAQLLFTKSYLLPIKEVSSLDTDTKRGEGGFGSSGA